MVKVIAGLKGSGKTKQLIDMVNTAIEAESGDVVCMERGSEMMTDINHRARLIDTSMYPITGYHTLEGFVSGMYAANFDITHVFIDNLTKIVKNEDPERAVEFITWLAKFSEDQNVKFTVTISIEEDKLPEAIKAFM